jgi:hypothetical protein
VLDRVGFAQKSSSYGRKAASLEWAHCPCRVWAKDRFEGVKWCVGPESSRDFIVKEQWEQLGKKFWFSLFYKVLTHHWKYKSDPLLAFSLLSFSKQESYWNPCSFHSFMQAFTCWRDSWDTMCSELRVPREDKSDLRPLLRVCILMRKAEMKPVILEELCAYNCD